VKTLPLPYLYYTFNDINRQEILQKGAKRWFIFEGLTENRQYYFLKAVDDYITEDNPV